MADNRDSETNDELKPKTELKLKSQTENVRVYRIVEYRGPRRGVESQVGNSLHGTKSGMGNTRITAQTIGEFVDPFYTELELKQAIDNERHRIYLAILERSAQLGSGLTVGDVQALRDIIYAIYTVVR